MQSPTLETAFLPAERTPTEELARQRKLVHGHPLLPTFCEAVPQPLVILNRRREIVLANRPFHEMLGIDAVEELVGKRQGEVLGCAVARRTPGGCGTAEECRSCGGALTVVAAQQGQPGRLACVIDRDGECVPFELEASARSFELDGEELVLLVLVDVRDQHRRRILERLFFHDVLNTAGGLVGLTQVLSASAPAEFEELTSMLASQGHQLLEEIKSQRDLTAAEDGDLVVDWQDVRADRMVHEVRDAYRHHPVAASRVIGVIPGPEVVFVSDPVLLARVLGNLLKNALEACPPGATVTLNHAVEVGDVVFRVWNPGEVPAKARRHLFKRTFSTKGADRGLGTYSIRLLVEQFLGGRVGFESNGDRGTNFQVRLPVDGAEVALADC